MTAYLFTSKIYLIWYILVYSLVGGVVLLGSACQNNPSPPPTPTKMSWFDPNEDISFSNQPHWLRMFHINPEVGFGNQPVLLTWYERPYGGSFNFVLILESGIVKIYSESPTWARRGGISPVQLEPEEHQKIKEHLQTLSNIEIPNVSPEIVMIVLSFEITEGERQRITCTQSTCPAGVKEIFQIVHFAFKRKREYMLVLPMPFTDE